MTKYKTSETSETYWICEGPQEDPHYKERVPRDERCPICDRDRNSVENAKKTSVPILPILGIIALLSALGLGGKLVFSQLKSRGELPAEITNPTQNPNLSPTTPTPTSIPTNYSWEPDRFSKGERTLFPWIANANRENGFQAFRKQNYGDATDFFEKAITADRNDPEVLIFKNNAFARQNGNYLTLAAVVPVDTKGSSAQEMLRGIAMAQNEFNESGGVHGQLLEIVIANDGNSSTNAEQVAQQLANDQSVLGVIGHNSSDASEAALEIYESAGLAMISPTSTSTSLNSPVFFRTVPSDEAAGKKLAEYLDNELQLKRVVVFYNPKSTYSNSIYGAFDSNFNGKIVGEINIDTKDPNSVIEGKLYTSVIDEKAQAALLFPNTDLTSVAIEIAQANAKIPIGQRLKLLGGDTLYNPTTLKAGGEAVEDLVLAVSWFKESPQSQDFRDARKRWGGSVNWRTAMSYDATKAFIAAFSATPNSDRISVISDLAQVEISSRETSGADVQFTQDGEREGESVLVKATRDAEGRPKGSEFGFDLIE